VVDAGQQANLSAHGIGGLLGHNGLPPSELYAAGRRELAEHPNVEVREGSVQRAEPEGNGFAVELADGARETSSRLLLATGLRYEYPDVPGIAERWGGSVFHCPFCHGWEVRDGKLGVLAGGEDGVRLARLLRGWSDDVTMYSNGPSGIAAEDIERLRDAGITIDERVVTELHGPGADLTAIGFADDAQAPCTGLLVATTMTQASSLPEQLGVTVSDLGRVARIDVDSTFATSVDGVYAAGDASVQMPSVANAIASGSTAAAVIVHSLI
jgi:thioredoxin reductase